MTERSKDAFTQLLMREVAMTRLGYATLTSVFLFVSPALGLAQESPAVLAASASSDAPVVQAFQNIERAARVVDHYVAYSIIASSGGWLVVDAYGDNQVSNSYVIRNNVDDQKLEVSRAAATVDRSKTATEAEKDAAKDAATSMNAVFEASLAIAESLESGNPSKAAELYRSMFIEPQEAALRASHTGASNTNKRLNKTLLAIRMLK
jgi:hypothetical protein